MRLEKIELINWRSFLTCKIDLSSDITVIIGQNSAGKTALLNAFVWGLYEQTTPGFSEPDDLCNHQVKYKLNKGETTKTEVIVTFLHSISEIEHRYIARRSLTVTRTGPGNEDFDESKPQFVLNIHPIGSTSDSRQAHGENAEREVQSIIPASLNPYFFFPAENIGSSIGASDIRAATIKDAVSVLLGLKRYEVANDAIKAALRLPKLKEKKSNDLDIRKAQESRDRAREQYDKACADMKELDEEIVRVERLQEKAEQAVKQVSEAQELIEERRSIQNRYKKAQHDAELAADYQRQILNQDCFNLFGVKVLTQAQQILDKAKSDDKIPPKLSAGLLDDLIANAEACICGQSITDSERSVLRKLRQVVVDDIVAESASNIRARVTEIGTQLATRPEEETPHAILEATKEAIADSHRSMSTWLAKREEFDMANPAVGGNVDSDPSGAFLRYTRTLEQLKTKQDNLRIEIETLARGRSDADNKCEKLQKQRGQADKVINTKGHLNRIEQAVEGIQKALGDGSRRDLERAINKIASQVLLRDYTINLTPKFDIEVRQNDIIIGGSSSDHSWVTFAFVGAISGLIDAYNSKLDNMDEAGNIEIETGSGYPLVLDAPFSPFGPEYAAEFAEQLPALAPQTVLIVREDQLDYLNPILSKESDKVRAYLMCFHGPPTIDKQEIVWRGQSKHIYVKPADDSNSIRTELEELPL